MKKWLRLGTPATTVVLFVLAIVLLAGSGAGVVNALPAYLSEHYASRVEMYDIGVSLLENGKRVSWRDYVPNSNGDWDQATGVLLGEMVPKGEELCLGRAYPEALAVQNSGTIDQYVRVTLYKYWLDRDGQKLQTLNPSLIELELTHLEEDWLLDPAEDSNTPERTVLYYRRILPSGETTPPLSESLTINPAVAARVTEQVETLEDGKRITLVYDYDGAQFVLEAQVDAVQTHNAEDAILSAWGRRVSVNDGTLSIR